MKWPVALTAALCLSAEPAWSQIVTRERGAGMSAPTQFQIRATLRTNTLAQTSPHVVPLNKARVTRANDENIWVIGCKLMINYTDTIETADKMQRDLDDALNDEPCRRAAAEISLADRLRLIRDRIRELRDEEEEG